ncbi:DUF1720 domain-containing protein [Corynebacterium macclintockiae]|uniref:DUF1720 domain-containing protein n=1 Tax=Corynebacterium macclintockiae TaxID=2913501 RepID=UPI003EB6FA78
MPKVATRSQEQPTGKTAPPTHRTNRAAQPTGAARANRAAQPTGAARANRAAQPTGRRSKCTATKAR